MYKIFTAILCRRRYCFLLKYFLIMKLSLLLVLVAFFQAYGAGFAQKVDIKVANAPLLVVFDQLREQTGYDFIYNFELVRKAKPVSLNFHNASLTKVLDRCLSDQRLIYRIENSTVIIREAAEKEPPVVIAEVPPIRITGKVTDDSGQGLPGVTIRLKNGNAAVVSDADGNFRITVPGSDAVLVFTFVGFQQQEVPVRGTSVLNIKLKAETKGLEEVVVVGYGTQKKVNLTGAVASISGDDIALKPVGQTSAALQGAVSGVTVIQRSGRPGGDAASIRVRGIGTISGADPLVMIDGIEGSMNNIDPNLIESISILKDAASSSIYGSRAANGVILITTKRSAGDRLSVSYNNYVGWQHETNMPRIASALDHMLLTNEAYVNTGKSPLYADTLIEAYRRQNGRSSDQYPNTDWQKETMIGSGLQQSHFASVNGGTKKVKVLTSFGYFDQKGLIENTSFRRYTLRNNADFQLSDKLSARFDFQYVNPTTIDPAQGSGTIFQWMNGIARNQIGINENGTWGVGWNGANPISASIDGGTNQTKGPFGSINAVVNYKPFSWLTTEVAYAPKYAESLTNNFTKAVQSYFPDGSLSYLFPSKTTLTQGSSQSYYNNLRATLTANKTFKYHTITFLAGASREDYSSKNMSGYRENFIFPEYPVLDAGSAQNQKSSGAGEEWALQSLFGRLNYNFKEKYLLEVNARYDGSSRFAKGHKYGFFPSASAGWRISEESFMEGLKSVVNNAKLRLSWGQLGNQNIGTYPSTSAIALGSYTFNGQIVDVAALNDLANREISWETTEEKNIGLDLTLFSNFNITADYYQRRTKDILLQLQIPMLVGLNAPYQNAGVVDNKGWELGLSYAGRVNDFKYNISFNLSDVRNKVVDMRGINQTGLTVNREGYEISSIYGYEAQGFFNSDDEVANHATQFGAVKAGDIKYKDMNNDGLINESDKVIIGSTIPRYTFGSTINASYKGFDVSVMLQGVGKADGYLYGAGITPFTTTGAVGGTIREDNKDRWTPDHMNAKYPRLAFGETNNSQYSSFWLKDAAYLRLKNLQIGYLLPSQLASRVSMKRLRLFVNGSNLFTIDNFLEGYDVEAPVGNGNYYPQVKVYSFGLEASF